MTDPGDIIDKARSAWAIFAWVRQHFGGIIAVLLALSLLAGEPGVCLDEIVKRPAVSVNPPPIAQSTLLNIALAPLNDDKDQENDNLLRDELGHQQYVKLVPIDRSIDTEEAARAVLQRTGVDVLIWGIITHLGSKSKMRLYWTPSRTGQSTGQYLFTDTLELPTEFWPDLKPIVRFLIQSRVTARVFEQSGYYVSDKLTPLIAQVRERVQNRGWAWKPETLAGVQLRLANALAFAGAQSSKNEPLAESIDLYHKLLDAYPRNRAPLDWAKMQNNLGIALETLGKRENGTARLEEAVAAYREALKERTQARVPLSWAETQNNLGNAFTQLGEREGGIARLEEAVAAYREALKEWTQARVPLQWAGTQNNLGNALTRLGEQEGGTARLEEAVAAYREALKVLTKADHLPGWAMTQNNLGTALETLGKREGETARLEEAVAAYREALQGYTQARTPFQWATTQNNLGNALRALGERESGTKRLEEAVAAYHEALKVLTQEAEPYHHDIVQRNLERASHVLQR